MPAAMTTILVLHGPNMALKGLAALDAALEGRAEVLALELDTVQSNGEAGLVDALLARADEVDGVLVNPGVLAPAAWALAEALTLVGKPAVEVLLASPPAQRGPSALAGAVLAQVHDQGPDGYLAALEQLATHLGAGAAPAEDNDAAEDGEAGPRVATRRTGRSRTAGRRPPPAPPPLRSVKTLGRRAPEAAPPPPAASAKTLGRKDPQAAPAPVAVGLTREQVKKQLSARLKGTLSPAELATWARGEWTALQKGAPVEPGWRDRLDAVLLALMGAVRATDDVLLAQLARLEG
jgi:3-dehydroquinate dehydratase II